MAYLDREDEIKKGHTCPPSTATHPADRWETAFIYSFICKFTKIKQDVDGLDTVSELVFAAISRFLWSLTTAILLFSA